MSEWMVPFSTSFFTRCMKRQSEHTESHINGDGADAQTHHFRVSPVDDDPRAVWRGGHLAGGARRRAEA